MAVYYQASWMVRSFMSMSHATRSSHICHGALNNEARGQVWSDDWPVFQR